MTITTATGKEYDCDMILENPSPPRLYLHIPGATVEEVSALFSDRAELPIQGYGKYREVQNIIATSSGVRVSLREGK